MRFCLLLLLIVVGGAVLQAHLPLNWDVASLLDISNRWLHGGHYGKAIMEPNPPMILYLYAIVTIIMQHTGWSAAFAMRLYVFVLGLTSLGLCYFLLNRITQGRDPIHVKSLSVALAILYFILPFFSFAQREHLMFILVMPYLLAAGSALQGRPVAAWLGCLVGFMAGVGIALKPYFLPIPVCVEAVILLSQKRWSVTLRAETVTLLAVLILYVMAVFRFEPGYIYQVLPLAEAYYPSIQESWLQSLWHANILYLLGLLLVWPWWCKRYDRYPALGMVLWAALLGGVSGVLWPRTPWLHHLLPSYGWAFLLTVHWFSEIVPEAFVRTDSRLLIFKQSLFYLLAFGLFIWVPVFFTGKEVVTTLTGSNEALHNQAVKRYLVASSGARSLMCIGLETTMCFPLAYDVAMHYASRFPLLWWFFELHAAEKGPLSGEAKATLERDKHFFIAGLADDLNTEKPHFVIVNQRRFLLYEGPTFDIMRYLRADPTFRRAWQPYQKRMQLGYYIIYERTTD